jgi:hypothetical protein
MDKVKRGMILFIPFLTYIIRTLVDFVDNGVNNLAIKLLDKFNLHEYERLHDREKYEML